MYHFDIPTVYNIIQKKMFIEFKANYYEHLYDENININMLSKNILLSYVYRYVVLDHVSHNHQDHFYIFLPWFVVILQ
jgi:hypothetical protein